MKKLGLIFTVLLMSTAIFAQKGIEKKADHFINAAVKEFKLAEKQAENVREFYVAQLTDEAAVRKQVKAEEMTQEDAKALSKERNLALRAMLAELTGKKPAEVGQFLKRTREEYKELNKK